MAQKELLFSLILFGLVFCANGEERLQFKKVDMDFAKELVKRSRQIGMSAIKEKWLELQKIRSKERLGQELVEEALNADDLLISKPILKVFVSSSMGKELLKHYVLQAKRYKAILVFKGLPGGSWRKLSDLIYEITGGEAEATLIQLDDSAFNEYGITKVPTFVLGKEISVFEKEKTAIAKFDKIEGSIGIRRALEQIQEYGDLAEEAGVLLNSVMSGKK